MLRNSTRRWVVGRPAIAEQAIESIARFYASEKEPGRVSTGSKLAEAIDKRSVAGQA